MRIWSQLYCLKLRQNQLKVFVFILCSMESTYIRGENNMKLLLFGGIQGVGKTTLLADLKKKNARRIKFVDPGDLFRRYFYNKKVKKIGEIEDLIVKKIIETPRDSVVVAHWHYAVRRKSRYIPQITFSRLVRIATSGAIEMIILFDVIAPIDLVRERRRKDYNSKKRSLSMKIIYKEAAANDRFLEMHRALFSRCIGSSKVKVVRLANIDLPTARSVFERYIKKITQ